MTNPLPLTADERAAAMELLGEATTGPWKAIWADRGCVTSPRPDGLTNCVLSDWEDDTEKSGYTIVDHAPIPGDAAFIAASRELIPRYEATVDYWQRVAAGLHNCTTHNSCYSTCPAWDNNRTKCIVPEATNQLESEVSDE